MKTTLLAVVVAWEFDDTYNHTKRAIVITAKNLDPCREDQVAAIVLSASTDVWVLTGDGPFYETVQVRDKVYFRAPQPVVPRTVSWDKFCSTNRSGTSKGSFLAFLASSPYSQGFLVEDDVLFSGPWSYLMNALQFEDAMVYTSKPKRHHWPWGELCSYDGKPCSKFVKLWPIGWFFIGVSRDFASYIIKELDSGRPRGHHEATTAVFCKNFTCRTLPRHLYSGRGFYFTNGHVPKTTWTFDRARAQTDQPIDRRLWHPVKCEADASIGSRALEWGLV